MSEAMKEEQPAGSESRRTLLRLGAAAVPAFVTLKPAFAAQASIMKCQLPLTSTQTGSQWIKPDGTLTNPNTSGAFPPLASGQFYTGDELKKYIANKNMLPGGKTLYGGGSLNGNAMSAHYEYIKRLSFGQPGYTCFVSLRNSTS